MSVTEDQLTHRQDGPVLPLWKNHDFMLYWSGQCISSLGTNVSQLAFPLLVLFLTGSPAQAGSIGALNYVPYVLLGLPIGVMIDRWDRKWILRLSSVGRGLCMASIPLAFFLGHLTLLQLYLVALIDGSCYTFFSLAEVSSVPHLVPAEQLPVGMAAINGLTQLTSLFGAFCGGVLYTLGRTVPFLVDAFSYVFCIILFGLTRTRFQKDQKEKRRKLHIELAEGLRWFWQRPILPFMAVYDGAINVLMGSIAPFTVIILAQQQGASPLAIGLVRACGGVGACVGLFLTPLVHRRFRYHQIVVGAGCIWTLLWLSYSLAETPLILGIVSFAIFTIFSPYSVQMGYRLSITPDTLRGRVNSIHRSTVTAIGSLGLFVTGVTFQWLGSTRAILLIGCWMALWTLAALINPYVRRIEIVKARRQV